MRFYRLPSGATTTDIETYADEWGAFGDEIEKLLPGYIVYGYDPDISLRNNNNNDHVHLSTAVAKTLINTFEALKLELCTVRAQLVDRLLEDALRHD